MKKTTIATSLNSIAAFNQDFTRKLAKTYLPIIEKYHRAEFEGMEHIPTKNSFVAVGNHGGVHFMPEALLWLAKYHSSVRNVPMLSLSNSKIHNLLRRFNFPINQLGIVDDAPETAVMALESGFAITTYPGGDRDLAQPFSQRNKVDFFGNNEYARAAIATGKPILPIVGYGGGETVYTLDSGEGFAKRFKLDKLFGIKSWPIFWSFPRGLHTGHLPHFSIPFPSKVIVSVLPPVLTQGYDPTDADNPEVVRELDATVQRLMQKELDEIADGRIPALG